MIIFRRLKRPVLIFSLNHWDRSVAILFQITLMQNDEFTIKGMREKLLDMPAADEDHAQARNSSEADQVRRTTNDNQFVLCTFITLFY